MDYDWILMRELIFVDTETTGLDPNTEEMVELTWARLEGDPETLYFGVEEVSDFIDNLIGFTKRGISGRLSTNDAFTRFLQASEDNIMVAANPAFDKAFIEAAGIWRFHYRMLDIESYAMCALDLNEVPGMKTIEETLTDMGFTLPEPDHTSRGDVLCMRDAYQILRRLPRKNRTFVSA